MSPKRNYSAPETIQQRTLQKRRYGIVQQYSTIQKNTIQYTINSIQQNKKILHIVWHKSKHAPINQHCDLGHILYYEQI